MMIDHYIDNCFSIVDGTLISCKCEHRKLVIPAEINGHRIYRIGCGCSIGSGTECVVVSEGIKELGEEAFVNSPYLETVMLPASLEKTERYGGLGIRYLGLGKPPVEMFLNRSFPETLYGRLLEESIRLTNGERMLTGNYAELDQFKNVLNSYGNLSAPIVLSPEMGSMFILDKEEVRQLSAENGSTLIADGEKLDHNSFVKRVVPVLARKSGRIFWDNESDATADKALQQGEKVFPRNVLLCTFSEEKVRRKKGRVLVCFRIRFEQVFIPMITEVRYKGRSAYVYSEVFLNNEKKKPFLRRDDENMVFDASGKHIEGKEVYSKYRFMAMLS